MRYGSHGKIIDPVGGGQVRRVVLVKRERAGEREGRDGQRGFLRDLPQLGGGRTVHIALEDTAHQRLHLRLRLLPQPALERYPPRGVHPAGGRRPHDQLLQAELHRRPLPQFGRDTQSRLHDGASDRGREAPPHGLPFPRLHPLEGHPRRRPGSRPAGRALRRPPERQHRASLGNEPETPRAGQEQRLHPQAHGTHRRELPRLAGGAREVPQSPGVRTGGAEHPAHRRRHSRQRLPDPPALRKPLPQVRTEASLLLGLPSRERRQTPSRAPRAALTARAPALPERLAPALLRVRGVGTFKRRAPPARYRRRSQGGLGAPQPPSLSRRGEPRRPARPASCARHRADVRAAHRARPPLRRADLRGLAEDGGRSQAREVLRHLRREVAGGEGLRGDGAEAHPHDGREDAARGRPARAVPGGGDVKGGGN